MHSRPGRSPRVDDSHHRRALDVAAAACRGRIRMGANTLLSPTSAVGPAEAGSASSWHLVNSTARSTGSGSSAVSVDKETYGLWLTLLALVLVPASHRCHC